MSELESNSRVTYILDTNVLLTDSDSIFAFNNADVVLPITVLDELDKIKTYDGAIGYTARKVVRKLNKIISSGNGNHKVGFVLPNNSKLKIKLTIDTAKLPKILDKTKNDNKILETALSMSGKKEDIVLITNDVAMTAKGGALGLKVRQYVPSKGSYEEGCSFYSGQKSVIVEDSLIDAIQGDEDIFLPKGISAIKNEFLIMRSNIDNKKTVMARYIDKDAPLRKIYTSKNVDFFGISPKNKEQRLCIDLLTDPTIDLVTLIGASGSGKTLCALATGLAQVTSNNRNYARLIVTRPIQPFGKDIGYLPGLMEDKMSEWLKPVWDNLYEILGNKKIKNIHGFQSAKNKIDEYIEQGLIEVEALTYIKGRSISNAFIVVDEAEDLTEDSLKRIITRVGHNSKIVLTGDISQIDNPNNNPSDSGLANIIKKMMDNSNIGHMTLTKSERSPLVALASEVL